MISIKTDLHTHTTASLHAYSTIEENIRNGAQLGLEAVGVADHFSGLFYPGTDFSYYGSFTNYKAVPRVWHGVNFLHGAEADIVDLEGHLFGHDQYVDLPIFPKDHRPTYEQMILNKLDYLIASVHFADFAETATIAQTTEMYCKALNHPKVMLIGHIGRAGVPFDMDEVLLTAKRLNKMIEINNASLSYPEDVTSLCRKVAVRCAELGVSIAVNSDAHSAYYVGRYDAAVSMLEEIHFPEELIGNRSMESLKPFLEVTKTKK